MKYYIPISSLNLDNILQAESISPSSFYARRKTGYNDFEVITEFRGINKIVLFECPVCFSINDPNRYNFPVLIEIEDEQQLCNDALQHGENGLCLYSKTLYLTPYNCRIFFFSERDFKLIIINTKDNKTLKYYDKYHIYPTAEKLGELKNMPLVKALSDQIVGDSNETQNDKKKGVLYAYLVGQSLSSTPELARQKYLTQEIYNTYAGIKAFLKTNQRVPDIYIKKLAEQLDAYKAVDPIERENRLKIDETLKKIVDSNRITIETFKNLLKGIGEDAPDDYIYTRLSSKLNAPILPLASELHFSNDYTYLIELVEKHTAQSIASYKNEMPKPSLSAIKADEKSISIEGKELLNIAINYAVDKELTQDKLAANRAEICSKIINQIKDYFITEFGYSEEQWQEDPHRQYALYLYNSISDYRGSFSLNDAKKLKYGAEFMAIAAFILKGDRIDSYLQYLLKNEVVDYSMPLTLWGALCGYMEMNRDRLSEFLTDETYEDVYEHLYGTKPYKAIFNDVAQVQQPGNGYVRKDDFLFVVERARITPIFSKLKKSLNCEFVTVQDIDKTLSPNQKEKQCNKARQIFDRIARKKYNELEKLLPKGIWPDVAKRFGIQVATSNKTKRTSTNRGGKESQGNDRDRSNNSISMPDLFSGW